MMEILLSLDLRGKISQGSRRDSPIEAFHYSKDQQKVKGLHPSLKRGTLVVPKLRSLLVLNVVRKM